jgi:hypothetical protein
MRWLPPLFERANRTLATFIITLIIIFIRNHAFLLRAVRALRRSAFGHFGSGGAAII